MEVAPREILICLCVSQKKRDAAVWQATDTKLLKLLDRFFFIQVPLPGSMYCTKCQHLSWISTNDRGHQR